MGMWRERGKVTDRGCGEGSKLADGGCGEKG